MKALLICPAKPDHLAALTETVPLATAPILGKTLLEYWLEQLVIRGAREIFVLASDRPEQVLALAADGARWGLQVSVHPEVHELTPAEARTKYREVGDARWLPAPHDTVFMDHLPAQPEFPLFTSYAAWFAAVMNWLPRAATPDRIGVREIKPGVWTGRHSRIAPDAELHAPCWLGEHVFIGSGASIGPRAVVEDRTFIEAGAKVTESIIGPETFVGEFTEIQDSLAWGDTLINWKFDSCLKVPDSFLLSPLKPRHSSLARFFQPLAVEPRPLQRLWKFSFKTEP